MDHQKKISSRQRLKNRLITIILATVAGALIVAVVVLAVARAYRADEAIPTPTVPAISALLETEPLRRQVPTPEATYACINSLETSDCKRVLVKQLRVSFSVERNRFFNATALSALFGDGTDA